MRRQGKGGEGEGQVGQGGEGEGQVGQGGEGEGQGETGMRAYPDIQHTSRCKLVCLFHSYSTLCNHTQTHTRASKAHQVQVHGTCWKLTHTWEEQQ